MHGIQLILIIRHRGVGKTVEYRKLLRIIPHDFIICVEDMNDILVAIDAFHLFGVNVSSDIWSFVAHKH
jgi:hypothetical protein